MDWVTLHVSELQDLPEGVQSLTETLIASELFTVDFAGALALGMWPEAQGAWATRKAAESEKFSEVLEWRGASVMGAGGTFARGCISRIDGWRCWGFRKRRHRDCRGSGSGGPDRGCYRGLLGGGAAPVEVVHLRNAIRDSIAMVEDWDISRCAQACTDLVHEAARLRPQLGPLRDVHPFGKAPMKSLEAHAFEPLVYVLPELREEECELDELPAGREATVEHWRAFVHLLQARVGDF
ncbi:hypothetical protein CYMTET_13940 [Cymbomonas tetramitiformis]|uniref:Uncharacterized protein n=1 Tax=Cymbomonas tetramitiformis TaxID=36881 RepID=A0AAE0GHJ3_9CHLO|nr:hypothetical protein CYMTET_13940 [Cymbomonas tetramitiformis]